MKIKNILISIIFIFILSGCEATYTINIDDDYNETLYVTSNNPTEYQNIMHYDYSDPAYFNSDEFDEEGEKVEGGEYYNYSFNNGLKLDYKFKETYGESNIALSAFPSFKYVREHESVIMTYADIRSFAEYPTLEKITINVITNKEVKTHNADRVNGNTYTWVIRKEDNTKSIYIKYIDPNIKEKKNNQNNNGGNNNNQNNKNSNVKSEKKSHTILLIFLCLFLSFLVIFGIMFRGNKKD